MVVDDEEINRVLLDKVLKSWGFDVVTASNGQEALRIFQHSKFELVLADLRMPGIDGIQLLDELKKADTAVRVIIMTAFGSIETAVETIKKGAVDYITKPLDLEYLKILIDRIFKEAKSNREIENLKTYVDQRISFGDMIGASPLMKRVYQLIEKVAPTETSILIQGETGTGKELVARAIHLNSSRRDMKFVPLTCSALPETLLESELFGYEAGAFTGAAKRKIGLIEYADKGTLFLDEIADISQATQMKLLRVLQEKEFTLLGNTKPIKVDIRLISATNKDLNEEIKKGNFREDLFYRINVVNIRLPNLRERKEDIPLLAQHFMDGYNAQSPNKVKDISVEAMVLLAQYKWPGNVRQLNHVIERAVALDSDGTITLQDLPDEIISPLKGKQPLQDNSISLKQFIEGAEKDYLISLLKTLNGNVAESARKACLAHATLYEKMKKYEIDPAKYRNYHPDTTNQ